MGMRSSLRPHEFSGSRVGRKGTRITFIEVLGLLVGKDDTYCVGCETRSWSKGCHISGIKAEGMAGRGRDNRVIVDALMVAVGAIGIESFLEKQPTCVQGRLRPKQCSKLDQRSGEDLLCYGLMHRRPSIDGRTLMLVWKMKDMLSPVKACVEV
ncbi:hypothetical protein CR513_49772, partial [Mucuna pruriens]